MAGITDDIVIDAPYTVEGDFSVGDVNSQNIEAILILQGGQIYKWADFGVGIIDYLNAPNDLVGLKGNIIEHLGLDDYVLTNFDITAASDGITIDVDAKKTK